MTGIRPLSTPAGVHYTSLVGQALCDAFVALALHDDGSAESALDLLTTTAAGRPLILLVEAGCLLVDGNDIEYAQGSALVAAAERVGVRRLRVTADCVPKSWREWMRRLAVLSALRADDALDAASNVNGQHASLGAPGIRVEFTGAGPMTAEMAPAWAPTPRAAPAIAPVVELSPEAHSLGERPSVELPPAEHTVLAAQDDRGSAHDEARKRARQHFLMHALIDQPDVESAPRWFDELVQLHPDDATLLALLHETLWAARALGVRLIGGIGAHGLVGALAGRLLDEDVRVRLAVVDALARLGSPSAEAAMLFVLEDRVSTVRSRAWRTITRTKMMLPEVIVRERLESETDVGVLGAIIAHIRTMGRSAVRALLWSYAVRAYTRDLSVGHLSAALGVLADQWPDLAQRIATRMVTDGVARYQVLALATLDTATQSLRRRTIETTWGTTADHATSAEDRLLEDAALHRGALAATHRRHDPPSRAR